MRRRGGWLEAGLWRGVWAWLAGFAPAPLNTGAVERLRSCAGALIGLGVTGYVCTHAIGGGVRAPLLIAPMGASAVLLFGVPSSPLAQPWSIVGGNIVAALIGVTCAEWIGDPLPAAAAAAALAIGAMFALRCLHPPSGAVALTTVLGGPAVTAAGYHFVLVPVALNSVILMLAAVVFNNATGRAYPHPQQPRANVHHTGDADPSERTGVRHEDFDAVLRQYNQVLDVSRDDLEGLLQQAEMRAYRRRFGEVICADIMSRDVIAVQFGTTLQDAWSELRRHDIRALPVTDPARRVIGMVTDVDFMVHADLHGYSDIASRFRRFISRPADTHADRPEVVGQIMPRGVRTVSETTHIAQLVPLMADAGLRHVAVVDAREKLCGIISQSDLVAALYRGGLTRGGLTRDGLARDGLTRDGLAAEAADEAADEAGAAAKV
jgi:CBS domain-containing membrane protein